MNLSCAFALSQGPFWEVWVIQAGLAPGLVDVGQAFLQLRSDVQGCWITPVVFSQASRGNCPKSHPTAEQTEAQGAAQLRSRGRMGENAGGFTWNSETGYLLGEQQSSSADHGCHSSFLILL